MMQDLLRDVFVERNAQEWIDIAVRLGIPNSLVRNLAEVAEDEHLAARGLLYDSGIDGVKTVGTPFKLSLTPGTPRKRAPALDEDRAYILDPMKAKSATRTT
jgi:crotonobetainyl-CoA:carnitine CoA-transferase CaiB-like acyl-CoA transferase